MTPRVLRHRLQLLLPWESDDLADVSADDRGARGAKTSAPLFGDYLLAAWAVSLSGKRPEGPAAYAISTAVLLVDGSPYGSNLVVVPMLSGSQEEAEEACRGIGSQLATSRKFVDGSRVLVRRRWASDDSPAWESCRAAAQRCAETVLRESDAQLARRIVGDDERKARRIEEARRWWAKTEAMRRRSALEMARTAMERSS